MEIMDEDLKVYEPSAGSDDPDVRRQWRLNRTAAYRLGYKDREGKAHPASKDKDLKALETALTDQCSPPRGMDWNDFGILWDLHPEHPFTPVLRKQSVADQFQAEIDAENAVKGS